MTLAEPIAKPLADQCLAAVRERYAEIIPSFGPRDWPTLYPPGHDGRHWVIAWEAGPYDWAVRASLGGWNDETAMELAEFASTDQIRALSTETPILFPREVLAEPV